MDTASYSFSACSDGSVSYAITCTGPDCGLLGDLFGSICSSSGDTLTCTYNGCTGPVNYVSTAQISASNSTFYAVNDLSIKDGADVSFDVNGTSVLPLVAISNSQSSTTSSASTTSASLVPTTISSPSSNDTYSLNLKSSTTSGRSQSFTIPSNSSESLPIPSNGALNTTASLPYSRTSEISTLSLVIPPPATSPSPASTSRGVANTSSSNAAPKQSSSGSASQGPSPLLPSQSSTSSTQPYVAVQLSTGPSGTKNTVSPLVASTQTVTAGSASSSVTTTATKINVQQSSGASRSKRGPAGFASFLPILLLLFHVMTPAVMASGLHSNPLVGIQSPSPFSERGDAISPVPLDRKALITPRGFVGPAIGDASIWVNQFTNFFCDNEPNLSSDLITLGTDILDFVCQVVLGDLETNINREVLFKEGWQQCVALGETSLQGVQQFINNTHPPGTGLGGHYLTVGSNFAIAVGAKAGCDFLFARLLQWRLGVNPVDQTCDAFMDSLGLIPPDAGTLGCPSLTGGCSCSSGDGGGGGGGGGGRGGRGGRATSVGSGGQSTTTTSAPASSSSTPSCPTTPGWEICNGECLNTLYDNNNCLDCGSVCPDDSLCCDGECLDSNSEEVCGSCNVTCFDGICANGVCLPNTITCPTGWGVCNGECTFLLGDTSNCGACGHTCTGDNAVCSDGYSLDCPSSAPDACGALGCLDLDNDVHNCGNCGDKCPSSDNYCFEGTCKFCDLAAGYGICPDGIFTDVDCFDLQADSANCAGCGNVCPGESLYCVNGACNPCPGAGYTPCGIYGCVDLDTNPAFCGSCNTSCLGSQTCSGGGCVDLSK